MSFSGLVKGKVRLESSDRMFAEDILKSHPELQSFLDEIEKQGWKYLYIETVGTSVAEVDLDGCQYRVRIDVDGGSGAESRQNVLEIRLGQKAVMLSDVPEVGMFRINVSTKTFPRAVTVDIAKGLVTFLNDAFWAWQPDWEKDAEKLSEAREVLNVAKWLLDAKKQKLSETYSMERFNQLSRFLEAN